MIVNVVTYVCDILTITTSNEETCPQDFLENLEEMFLEYYICGNICRCVKYSNTIIEMYLLRTS